MPLPALPKQLVGSWLAFQAVKYQSVITMENQEPLALNI
jgi:hypothetical protein